MFCRIRILPVFPSKILQTLFIPPLSSLTLDQYGLVIPSTPKLLSDTGPKASVGKMDCTKIERLQTKKRYRRGRRQFLPSLIQYLVAILLLGLLLSSLPWLATIFSSLELFYFAFLPNLHVTVSGPKYLFIVCNLIVFFLIGESKLSKSSLSPDIYEEYMNRNTNLWRLSTGESRKGSAFKKDFSEEGEEEKGGGGWKEVEGGYEGLDEEEKKGLDELNKRVEDFIARVKKQRGLEARLLLCYE